MTRDDIIRMVQDAREQTMKELPPNTFDLDLFHERFFRLAYEAGAKDEREACAKLVEPSNEHRRDASWGYIGGEEGVEMLDGIAAAIRARGHAWARDRLARHGIPMPDEDDDGPLAF